jgi:hypothetical protein
MKAKEKIETVVVYVNETKRISENLAKVAEIQNTLKGE